MCSVGMNSEVNVTLCCRDSVSSGIGDGATLYMHQQNMIMDEQWEYSTTDNLLIYFSGLSIIWTN